MTQGFASWVCPPGQQPPAADCQTGEEAACRSGCLLHAGRDSAWWQSERLNLPPDKDCFRLLGRQLPHHLTLPCAASRC